MTTTLAATTTSSSSSERLRSTTAAVRVSFTWMGVHRTLSTQQKARAAESFGAEGSFLTAGKKLLDTSHPAFRDVVSVRSRIASYWKGLTLPYPEAGIRLLRQEDVPLFDERLTGFREELHTAVERLEVSYDSLRVAARQRLGRLYSIADYPDTLRGLFDVEWDFPAVEPPEYLRQLNPELYRQESARLAARFDEAVRLAEEAFTSELARLVSHLSERLTGQLDGQPKVFRDSALENLGEFFQRFGQLSLGSNTQLEELVAEAQQIVRGLQPQQLRDSASLRQHVAGELSRVESVLDGLLVDRPRRAILRAARQVA